MSGNPHNDQNGGSFKIKKHCEKTRSSPLSSPRPRRRTSVSPKKEYTTNDQVLSVSEHERWKKWMKKAEMDMEELRQNSEKYECLYRRQKELCETRTEELVLLETKFSKLEKHCNNQGEVMARLRLEHQHLAQELEEKKNLLSATAGELKMVRQKAEELSIRLPDVEKQLQCADDARRAELENLRSLQSSFEASERHFASVLEQVRTLIQENEVVYQNNCKLTKEKLEVDKELTLRMQISTALATQLAKAHDEMKQINRNIKCLENEKEHLFKKLKEQRIQISNMEEELDTKEQVMQRMEREKAELEGQLKLSNLCLSRALSDKNRAAIFPKKSESQYTESSACPSQSSVPNQILLPQVKLLRDEISAKDDTIRRLIEEINKLEEELQDCRMDLLKEQELNKVNRDCFQELSSEPTELEKEIQLRERAIDSMKVTIEKVISQRNRLGLQCVRKKEQINLLKEKNRVLEEIMLVGNRLYDQGLKKIQDLKMAGDDLGGPTVSVMMQKVEDFEFIDESIYCGVDRQPEQEVQEHGDNPGDVQGTDQLLKAEKVQRPFSTFPRTTEGHYSDDEAQASSGTNNQGPEDTGASIPSYPLWEI